MPKQPSGTRVGSGCSCTSSDGLLPSGVDGGPTGNDTAARGIAPLYLLLVLFFSPPPPPPPNPKDPLTTAENAL